MSSAAAFDAAETGTPARAWAEHLDQSRQPLVLDDVRRIVVVGAHPDDESLGAGGLVAAARAQGIGVSLVCVTDGAASHPDSPTHSPPDLIRRRAQEWALAAGRLGVAGAHQHWLGLPDGEAANGVESVAATLVELIGDGRGIVLVAPWREDAHPDHAAVGRAAAAAARRTDAQLWEYPLWFWHWARPGDARTDRLRPMQLSPATLGVKQSAIAAHASQVTALSGSPGDEPLLRPEMLEHFAGEREWFVVTPGSQCDDGALERLHRQVEDPWGVDARWFERRKRELLLASLPRPRFRHALEIGCSTGALTEALGERADEVLGVDSSDSALVAAGRRLADLPGIALVNLDVPAAWPAGEFDLVVISEMGYFLSPAAVNGLVRRVAACLAADGVLVLCHWRHPVAGWVMDGAMVHGSFETAALPPLQATYQDRDVEIRVHARDWPDHDR